MKVLVIICKQNVSFLIDDLTREKFPKISKDDWDYLDASAYKTGGIHQYLQGGLFSQECNLYLKNFADSTDELLTDLKNLSPEIAANLVIEYIPKRGERLLKKHQDCLKHLHPAIETIPEIKWDNQRVNFIIGQVRKSGKNISPDAARVIEQTYAPQTSKATDASASISLLYQAAKQLVFDCQSKTIDVKQVHDILGFNQKIQIFQLTNALGAADLKTVIKDLFICEASKTEPIMIVASLVNKVRKIALKQDLRVNTAFWNNRRLAFMQSSLANIDFDLKTGKAAFVYTKLILLLKQI